MLYLKCDIRVQFCFLLRCFCFVLESFLTNSRQTESLTFQIIEEALSSVFEVYIEVERKVEIELRTRGERQVPQTEPLPELKSAGIQIEEAMPVIIQDFLDLSH